MEDDWDALFPAVGAAPQQGGPVYGPPPKAPAPPTAVELERLEIAKRTEARQNSLADLARQKFEFEQKQAAAKSGEANRPASLEEKRARILTSLDNLDKLDGMTKGTDMATGSIVGQESFRSGDSFLGFSKLVNQRANDVSGSIEMVQGDLINQVRNEMQESGAPIGVKGADTEKEASRLAASIANLAQTQDEPQFRIGIERAREYYKRRLEALEKELAESGLTGSVTHVGPNAAYNKPADIDAILAKYGVQ